MFKLDGKVAVVVGGGGGIGKALALGLARYGANVALCSRTSRSCRAWPTSFRPTPKSRTR